MTGPGQESPAYTTALRLAATPAEAYATVNDPASWWARTCFMPGVEGVVSGGSSTVGDEFVYSYADIHRSRQRVVELVAERRVVWLVTEGYLTLSEPAGEWKGTRIVFDIEPDGEQTRLTFTHEGLTPSLACFDSCSSGWDVILSRTLATSIARAARARIEPIS